MLGCFQRGLTEIVAEKSIKYKMVFLYIMGILFGFIAIKNNGDKKQ
jgi:hypothetical protein